MKLRTNHIAAAARAGHPVGALLHRRDGFCRTVTTAPPPVMGERTGMGCEALAETSATAYGVPAPTSSDRAIAVRVFISMARSDPRASAWKDTQRPFTGEADTRRNKTTPVGVETGRRGELREYELKES